MPSLPHSCMRLRLCGFLRFDPVLIRRPVLLTGRCGTDGGPDGGAQDEKQEKNRSMERKREEEKWMKSL